RSEVPLAITMMSVTEVLPRTSSTLTSTAFRSSSAATAISFNCSACMQGSPGWRQSPYSTDHPGRDNPFGPSLSSIDPLGPDHLPHRVRHQVTRALALPYLFPDARSGDVELRHRPDQNAARALGAQWGRGVHPSRPQEVRQHPVRGSVPPGPIHD